jgi:hypothetical protein
MVAAELAKRIRPMDGSFVLLPSQEDRVPETRPRGWPFASMAATNASAAPFMPKAPAASTLSLVNDRFSVV